MRRLLALAAPCALASCTPPPQPATPLEPEPPPPPPIWSRFAEVASFPIVSRPFRSDHWGVESRYAVVRASPADVQGYAALVPGATLNVGAVLVEQLAKREGVPPDHFLAMEKTARGWTYFQMDGEGRLAETSVALCQRCHQEALSDELFGLGEHGMGSAPASTMTSMPDTPPGHDGSAPRSTDSGSTKHEQAP